MDRVAASLQRDGLRPEATIAIRAKSSLEYAAVFLGALREHPDVAEAAVVGVPSSRWGESPVAFVVPRSGSAVTGDALVEWTNARVGKPQRLCGLELVAGLPRSEIGKVLKRRLRDSWIAKREPL